MTYGQVRDTVLRLINQYTVAGDPVADTYNNQADYIDRIPALVNSALLDVSISYKRIQATMDLDMLPHYDANKFIRYEMPFDFYQFKTGDTVTTVDGWVLHTNQYMIQGKRYLLIPKTEDRPGTMITYYRYPRPLPENPTDDDPLDNVPEVHNAICYYVAAQLVAHDDAFLTSVLNNTYADMIGRMVPDLATEVHPTQDAYGLDCINSIF